MRGLDQFVIFLYLFGVTILGVYFTRQQKTTKDYFLGGKSLPWWAILMSIIAQETSAVTVLSVPAIAFNPKTGNFTFLQVAFGYLIGRTLIAYLIVPRLYKGEYYSIYSYLTERFGAATKNVAVLTFLVTRVLAIGIRIFTGSILTKVLTGWSDTNCIIVITSLSILYTVFGGFIAVVWTDVLQFVVYILSAIAAMVVIYQYIPNMGDIVQTAAAAGKFQLFNFSWNMTTAYTFWAGLIGGCVLTMGTHGTDQSIAQRLLAAHSEKDAKKIIIASGITVVLQFAFYLFLGVMLYVFYTRLSPQTIPTFTKFEQVFPHFALNYLPAGLGGLAVAGVFAAAMSSNDFNPLSNSLINDIYKPYLRPNAPDSHYLLLGKIFTAFWGILTMFVALLSMQSEQSLLDLALKVPSYTYGPLLGLFMLGFFTKQSHQLGVIIGAILGVSIVLLIAPPWPEGWIAFKGFYPKLAWPWFTPIGCLTTMTTGYIISRLVPAKK